MNFMIDTQYICIKWRHSHDNFRETQYRDARFVYLSNDTFRIDKTTKQKSDRQNVKTNGDIHTIRSSRYEYHDNERKYL